VPGAALMAVLARLPLTPGAEVTVECNPDTVTGPLLDTYREGGVTRISMGVQSLDPTVLIGLGRTHRPANIAPAVAALQRAGFPSFSLDLIYGVAGETLASWCTTVEAVLEMAPPHVSAYALTVEPGTPLAAAPARHPDPDLQADMYLAATELLGQAGLEWYEISNFARPGHECRHNLLYWSQGDYLGFGAAAHSHVAGRRWWNLRTPERYIQAVTSGRSAEAAGEELDAAARRSERLTLALRTRRGVDAGHVEGCAELVEAGLLTTLDRGEKVNLTPKGRLLANEVALRLHPLETAPSTSKTHQIPA
jgi:putative oxygen-independent coproporphyrinogen III oxidase